MVKEAKIEEDAGEWTCKLIRLNDEDTKTIDVTFKKSGIQDDVIETTTSKTRDSIQNQTQTQEQQKEEQSNGKQKLNIFILVFTFLILLGYAIGYYYLISGKCY